MAIENIHSFPESFTPEQKEIIFRLIDYSTYPSVMFAGGTMQDMIAGELGVPVAEVAKVIDELFKQMEEV